LNDFSALGVAQPLLKAIEELGFTEPTPIQTQVIPIFLQLKNDLIALAQTGTGKTAAFGLPIIQSIDVTKRDTQALILSPTRELCVQITSDLKNYAKYTDGVRISAVYGGASIVNQIREIRAGAHIIAATPGRLMDLMERKAIKLDNIRLLILDEADEMLNMGFKEDIEHILSFTPSEKITGLFSATMPEAIRSIAENYLENDPIEITVGAKNTAQRNISQQYALINGRDKYAALTRILDFNPDFYGIVFCTTKIETQEMADLLVQDGYSADCLHGDLSQPQRDKVMLRFRQRANRVLLATDVAARGIDVNDLTHVIHFSLPDDIENYTHRSGRTARAGKKGTSLALITPKDAFRLTQIERLAQFKFDKVLIPNAFEVRERKMASIIKHLANTEIEQDLFDQYVKIAMLELEKLDKKDLIMKMMTLELKKFPSDYLNSPDLNIEMPMRGNRNAARPATGGGNSRNAAPAGDVRLFINLGKKDRIRYDDMRAFVYKAAGVSGHSVRDIEMQDTGSYFVTDPANAVAIFQAFQHKKPLFKDRVARIDFADGKPPVVPAGGADAPAAPNSRPFNRGGNGRSSGPRRR
jgi:ATP-dependent RNA helicase DeaD